MFDSFKGMIGMAPKYEEFEIPDDFSLDDFAALNKKVKAQSPNGQGPLDQLKLDAEQVDAVIAAGLCTRLKPVVTHSSKPPGSNP